ncbi:MAG: hypothetical protein HQL59_09670 [Magnetococcales bacterium]|nr:hypothetical protein [Magnetococcales bacterium]
MDQENSATVSLGEASGFPRSWLCPTDGMDCELLSSLFGMAAVEVGSGVEAEAEVTALEGLIRSVLSCEHCRAGQTLGRRLPEVVLEDEERRLLLEAPPPDVSRGRRLRGGVASPAELKGSLKALNGLMRAGLVQSSFELTWCGPCWRFALTEFGAAVVDHFRREVEAGELFPVDERLPRILAGLRHSPERLRRGAWEKLGPVVERLREAVETTPEGAERQSVERQFRYGQRLLEALTEASSGVVS